MTAVNTRQYTFFPISSIKRATIFGNITQRIHNRRPLLVMGNAKLPPYGAGAQLRLVAQRTSAQNFGRFILLSEC